MKADGKAMTRRAPQFALPLFFLLAVPLLAIGASGAERARGLIWKVKSDTATVYLLGSFHLAPPSIYPLDPIVEKAYDSCDAIAVEANVEKLSTWDRILLCTPAVYTNDMRLKDAISPELYAEADGFLRKHRMAASYFDRFKPWLLGMTIELLMANDEGWSPACGIDSYFLKRATKEDKNILELESVARQVELLSNSLDPLAEEYIRSVLHPDVALKDMLALWKRGDSDALAELLERELREHPEHEPVFTALLFERNKGMAEKIAGYLDGKETIFAIVGAAHLPGKKGVVALLSAAGKYRIVQL